MNEFVLVSLYFRRASVRTMVSNSRMPISPRALHRAPLRVMSLKSDSDMWIRWSCKGEGSRWK